MPRQKRRSKSNGSQDFFLPPFFPSEQPQAAEEEGIAKHGKYG